MHTNDGYPTNVHQLSPRDGGAIAQGPGMNWFAFFKEEREIWIQNTSLTQLSLQFENGTAAPNCACLPVGPDPVCITNEVEFATLKKSNDFRKMLNRVPSVMRLLTSEQAYAYYTDKAKALNVFIVDPSTGRAVPNVGAAIEHAERERRALTTRQLDVQPSSVVGPDGSIRFTPPQTAIDLDPAVAAQYNALVAGTAPLAEEAREASITPPAGFSNLGDRDVAMEEVILPRVLYLCQQVSPQIPVSQRMGAEEFFGELKKLGELDIENLRYVESFGVFRTVKKWARELIAARTAGNDDEGIDDGLGG